MKNLKEIALEAFPLSLAEMQEKARRFAEKRTNAALVRTQKEIDQEKKYWQFVFEEETAPIANRRAARAPKTRVDYLSAKRKLAEIATQKLENSSRRPKPFQLKTEAERNAWEAALKWFLFDESGPLDPAYDLLIFGNTGRGKTFLVECLLELSKFIAPAVARQDEKFFRWNFVDVAELYGESYKLKSLDNVSKTFSKNWVFDEVGKEPRDLKIYGDNFQFFEKIITQREKSNLPMRGIYISNLKEEDILKHYNSSRIESRWHGMVGNSLMLGGENKR
jgi:DNA replication protein DnaC